MNFNQKLAYAVSAILGTCAAAAMGATDADTSPSSGLEEITVTAQRKSESIQDVPITIQAISGEALSQLSVATFDDAIKLLPNVTFSANGPGQGNIYMRGLSTGFNGGQSSASIAPFPNVAVYLDDQSLTFPSRNLDVYIVDMERIEVLEGPQGTLFGGGAEAGVLRYITNKPKLDVTEGRAEGGYGVTAHGDPNTSANIAINVPLIDDTLALRGVIYSDRRGGYIDNVPTTFQRNPAVDRGPSAYSAVYPAHLDTYNNAGTTATNQNPVTYQGARLSVLYKINDDWNALIQQTYQYLDAEGMSAQQPVGLGLTALQPLQETSFLPSWNKDKASTTSWTLNGKLGFLKGVYTGSYLTRTVDANMDYTNYTRTGGGFYYTCTGGGGSARGASGPPTCYSPLDGWHDYFKSTHQSHEIRVSTPEDLPLRGLVGAYWENFQIKDDMNFLQKTIPSCTPENLAIALAGGATCIANVTPVQAAIDPTTRNDFTNFGEDLQRGYRQYAAFVSADYDIIPKVLTITGGTRYFKYTEDEYGSQYGSPTSCDNIPNGACLATPISPDDHHATFTGFKSKGTITWHITPDAMFYYTYSQGYRPGAFNRLSGGKTSVWVDAAGVPLPNGVVAGAGDTKPNQFTKPVSFAPDSLLNNEIGFKSEFFDHRLLVNLSAYKMDWRNAQTLIFSPPVYGNTTFGVSGPDYRIKGVEMQLAYKPIEAVTLMANGSYNNASQVSSPCIRSSGVNKYTPTNPTPAGACITQVRAGNTNVAVVNPLGADGSVPAFSPKLQFNLRARYDVAFGEYKTFGQVGMTHIGQMYNEPSSFPSGDNIAVPNTTTLRYTMPEYNTFDASVGIAKGVWDVLFYGQNLADSNASTFTTSGQDIKAEVPLRPRVLGVKVGYKF